MKKKRLFALAVIPCMLVLSSIKTETALAQAPSPGDGADVSGARQPGDNSIDTKQELQESRDRVAKNQAQAKRNIEAYVAKSQTQPSASPKKIAKTDKPKKFQARKPSVQRISRAVSNTKNQGSRKTKSVARINKNTNAKLALNPVEKLAPKTTRKATVKTSIAYQEPKAVHKQKATTTPKPPIRFISPPDPAPAPETIITKKLDNPKLEKTTFLCGVEGNLPATVAEISKQEKIPVIIWQSDAFKGYDPQTRCKQVSARFEAYKKDGILIYLTTGKLNGQPVICITKKKDGDCGEGIPVNDGLLYTLQHSKNSEEKLEQLFARLQVEGAAEQKPLKE
jgi:hypothetical protein